MSRVRIRVQGSRLQGIHVAASQLLSASLLPHGPTAEAQLPRAWNPTCRSPWAREGSRFTLPFEQVVMGLVREMPVNAVAPHVEVTDTRLWRIVRHHVSKAIAALNLRELKAIGLDETVSGRKHNHITVFIDPDRPDKPVVLATPGKGKGMLDPVPRVP